MLKSNQLTYRATYLIGIKHEVYLGIVFRDINLPEFSRQLSNVKETFKGSIIINSIKQE